MTIIIELLSSRGEMTALK